MSQRSVFDGLLIATSIVSLLASGGVRAASQDARLLAAAKKNDVAAVRDLVKQHVNPNVREADGSTPLLWAAHMANGPMAELLVAAGADPNAVNRYGVTPLIEAARVGSTRVVAALLKAGASAQHTTPEGETPLMASAGVGNLESVKLLLSRRVDVNAKEGGQDQTALMWAAAGGHAGVVAALLAAGADPNAIARPASLSRVPLGDQGRAWVVHATGGLTALMFAARQGHVEAARVLADAGADLNHANPDGITALMIAVINDRLDLAAMLLDKGANANDGSLYEAVQLHNIRTSDTNLDASRPRLVQANALTPIDLIARLLDKGADPNRRATHVLYLPGSGGGGGAGIINPANESAFARALRSGDVDVLRVFLEKGANPNGPTDGGAIPLALALGGGGGGRGGPPGGGPAAAFRFPGDRTPLNAVNLLLGAGADVNAFDGAGDTPLHAAAQAGNVAMIRVLAQRGAKLDVPDRAGLTALDFAMGKLPPGTNAGRGRLGGPPGRGGPAGPNPQVIALLRELMGLPPLSPAEMPTAPARGGPPQLGGN